MATNVAGLFDTYDQAQFAVRRMIQEGIAPDAISIVAADPGGTVHKEVVDESGNLAASGMVAGGASGLLVGGLVGLLVGATVLAFPPAGFVVAGPVAGLITGAGVGMVSGGLLGGLIGLGIPEEEAHIYAESVRRGGIVVTVQASETEHIRAQQIMASCGAVNIAERAVRLRESGFTAYDPSLPAYTEAEILAERERLGVLSAPVRGATVIEETVTRTNEELGVIPTASLDDEFRADFATHHSGEGMMYETYRPAYHFGHELAHRDPTGWGNAETEARHLWESTNPGTWDRFRSAIHAGHSVGLRHVQNATRTMR